MIQIQRKIQKKLPGTGLGFYLLGLNCHHFKGERFGQPNEHHSLYAELVIMTISIGEKSCASTSHEPLGFHIKLDYLK